MRIVMRTLTFENNAVLKLGVRIGQPHGCVTARTHSPILKHSLADHPLETSLELLCNPKYFEVSLKAELYHIPFYHLSK